MQSWTFVFPQSSDSDITPFLAKHSLQQPGKDGIGADDDAAGYAGTDPEADG